MGQKTHPVGFRLGINKNWDSRWFAPKREYAATLHEDLRIKKYIKNRYKVAGIFRIEIDRIVDKLKIRIHASRPAIIIGRKGQEVELLKKTIEKMVPGKEVTINIGEIREP